MTSARARASAVALPLALMMLVGMAPADAMSAPPLSDVPDHTASFNGVVRTVTYHRGVAYLGGDFTEAVQDGVTLRRRHLAAVDAATGQVLPWRPRTNGTVSAIRVTRRWTYIGGAFTKVGKRARAHLARLRTPNGRLDRGFRADANGPVASVALSGRTLYVGGTFSRVDGRARPFLAAVGTRSGGLRRHWKPVANGSVATVVVSRGVVYAGGKFTRVNGALRGRHLASLNGVTGRLKRGYHSEVAYPVLGLVVTGSTIYAAADGPGGHLRALGLDGTSRWNVTSDGAVQALTILGGVIYIGGHFDHVCVSNATGVHGGCLSGTAPRFKLAALTQADGTLTSWAPQANSPLGTVALAHDAARGIVGAGGEWTTFQEGATAQQGFAQFSQVGAGS
jgi:hypothetical protein